MAHKTLINGTAYGIDGGKTLVNGTSYKVTNGKVLINGTAYDISFVLPPSALDLWSGTTSYNVINCIAYGNGYWVVGGQYRSGSTYYARIAYATSPSGTWATTDIWNGSSNTGDNIRCVAYGNGYWVVGGEYTDSESTHYARIAYATTISGTWTRKNLWGAYNASSYIKCITYANGYWVAGGKYYYTSSNQGGGIAYIASAPTGTWSTKDVWTGSGGDISCIEYAYSLFAVGGIYKSSAGNHYARIAYVSSPSGTWSTKDLWNSSNSFTELNGITYANGYWVVAGQAYDSGYTTRIAYTANPTISGTWTTKNLWSSGDRSDEMNCIAYENGYLVVGGEYYTNKSARISYADSASNLPA